MNTDMIAYSILKTEGDILFDMGFFDRAIKAYKTAKDFTDVWGPSFKKLKMRLYEQISVCYRVEHMYYIAIRYLKRALIMA